MQLLDKLFSAFSHPSSGDPNQPQPDQVIRPFSMEQIDAYMEPPNLKKKDGEKGLLKTIIQALAGGGGG